MLGNWQKLFRAMGYFVLLVIAVLSAVPQAYVPALSPATYADPLVHTIEHATIFLLAGLLFGIGYPNRIVFSFLVLGTYTLGVEIAQLWIPGRHARVSDLLIDLIAASVGLCIGTFVHRASD